MCVVAAIIARICFLRDIRSLDGFGRCRTCSRNLRGDIIVACRHSSRLVQTPGVCQCLGAPYNCDIRLRCFSSFRFPPPPPN